MSSYGRIFINTCDEYIDSCDINALPTCQEATLDILALIETRFTLENAIMIDRRSRFKIPHDLPTFIVARLIRGLNHAILINRTTTSQDDRDGKRGLYLAAYEDDVSSKRYGLYSSEKIEDLAREYAPGISPRGVKEVYDHLQALCKKDVRELTRDKNLIPMRNGIFNIETKQLMDFSSDYVFLTKARVDYNANASNCPVIQNPDGTTWDVDTWIKEIANYEPEIEQLLWEIIAAVLRGHHSFDKAALFYSPHGANGKGTFCEMLKAIIPFASINLSKMSEKFGLSALESPVAMIISDENSTEFTIKDATSFKCLVTHDPVIVERKYLDSYELTFDGLVVQCINKLPKMSDISRSLIRRLMIVPFKQQYAGKENRLIKEDYVHRMDVLEYIVHKAIDMDFDAFNVPAQCELLLEDFIEVNNSVYAFFGEIESHLKWDLIPNTFIFALYVGWMKLNMPMEKPLGRNDFLSELRNILDKFDDWELVKNGTSTAKYTFGCEPLIGEYNLYSKWGDRHMALFDMRAACTPSPKAIPATTGGILRKNINPFSLMSRSFADDENTSCNSMDGES